MIDESQREGLRRIKARDGIAESEQIRRAIDDWLERKGVTAGPFFSHFDEKGVTRKRPHAARKRGRTA